MSKLNLPRTAQGTSVAYYASGKTNALAVSIIRDGAIKSLYHIPDGAKDGATINAVCDWLAAEYDANDFRRNAPADKIETFRTRRPGAKTSERWERRSRTRTDDAEGFAANRRRDEDEIVEYEHTEISRLVDGDFRRVADFPFGFVKAVFDEIVNRGYVLFQRPNDKESFEAANDVQKIYNLASVASNRAPEYSRAFVYSKSKNGADFWDEYAYLLRSRLGCRREIFFVFPGGRDRFGGDAWNYAGAALAFEAVGLKPRLLELNYMPAPFRLNNRRYAPVPEGSGVYALENFFADARKLYGDSPRTLAELFDEYADFYSSEIPDEDRERFERLRAAEIERLRRLGKELSEPNAFRRLRFKNRFLENWLFQGRDAISPGVLTAADKEGTAQ